MSVCVYLQMSRTRDLTECVYVCMFTDVKNERFDRICLCVCLQMSRTRDLTECVYVCMFTDVKNELTSVNIHTDTFCQISRS